jgi:hypothetical protein
MPESGLLPRSAHGRDYQFGVDAGQPTFGSCRVGAQPGAAGPRVRRISVCPAICIVIVHAPGFAGTGRTVMCAHRSRFGRR